MAGRSRRNLPKRLPDDANITAPKVFPNDPLAAATAKDRQKWKGFCEIESEPAYFNAMLRDFGVKGVKVQEVVSLDQQLLAFLPRPIYGLIFLFKWREEDPDKLEQSCPEGVWFANQTVSNACASVALLNIVNNVPKVELGEHLRQFKVFTEGMTPALRGDAVSNFAFVKEIHNSYARKMDMLNSDLHMKNEVFAQKKSKKTKLGVDDDDAAFHFIAYVPVDNNVWKLDGLERQPQKLGSIKSEDWIQKAKPDIEARMAEYEEGRIEFAILSLVKDPLLGLIPALAENVKTLVAVASRLESMAPEHDSTENRQGDVAEGILAGPDPAYGLTPEMIEQAKVPSEVELAICVQEASKLRCCQQELRDGQARLRASIRDEFEANRLEEQKANARRYDYGPLALKLAQVLARKPIAGCGKQSTRRKKQKR